MGEYDPRNPRKIPGNKRPQRRRKKPEVPSAVIVIYIVMAILILAICAIVFAITLKKTNNTNNNSQDSGSSVVSNLESSEQSSGSESSLDSSGESSMPVDSSDSTSSSSVDSTVSSDTSSGNTSSSGEVPAALPTTFSKEFFKEDLFIGDSIFTGLSGYGYIDAANVAAKIGYTPYNAMNKAFDARGITAADYAKQIQPERIFIMLGSNAMGAGTNFDLVVSQYRDLVKKLRTDCPKSLICVISIPPVTADSSAAKTGNITNENIRKVNERIKAMAKEYDEEYFDLNTLLSDSNGYFRTEFAEKDGLHFRSNTYKVLLSALEKEMTP